MGNMAKSETAENTIETCPVSSCAGRKLGGRVLFVEHDVRNRLTDMVIESSQKQVADELGISGPFLNDVLLGRRGISPRLAEKLGFEKVMVFVGRDKG
jgi:hypothetical protein